MKKGIILAFILVLAASLALAGCGGSKQAAAPAQKDGKIVVHYWHSMAGNNGELVKAMVERYNASQNKVQVIETFQGGYEDAAAKLQQSIAAGTTPEIAMIERAFVERFAAANALVDLSPYLAKANLSKDMFVKGLMGYSEYNNDGKLVSVPFNRSTPILYYNKTAFKEVGLNPDKGPENWAQLKEFAEKLTKKDGAKTVRYGLTWPIETWYFKAMVAQSGGRTINEKRTDVGFADNGTGLAVLNFWVDLKNSGVFKVAPAQDGPTISRQAFINGEAAMFMESTSLMGTVMKNTAGKFEVGAAFLPMNKLRAMPTGGANVAMMAKGKNKDAAWDFLKWMLTDPQGGAEFCLKSGYMPFTKQMIDSPEIQALWKKNPQFKVAFDQLNYAVDTEQHLHWSELKAELKKALQAVMHDNKDPKAVIDNLSKEAKRILAQ